MLRKSEELAGSIVRGLTQVFFFGGGEGAHHLQLLGVSRLSLLWFGIHDEASGVPGFPSREAERGLLVLNLASREGDARDELVDRVAGPRRTLHQERVAFSASHDRDAGSRGEGV